MSLLAVAAGAAIVGTITNLIGSRKAAKAAKKQGDEEARIGRLTTEEQLRRLTIDERTMRGETLSGYARGGVQAYAPTLDGGPRLQTGSPQTVLNEQAREFAAERDITKEVGASNVQQALMRAKGTASAYKWQGYSNAASSISNILGMFK